MNLLNPVSGIVEHPSTGVLTTRTISFQCRNKTLKHMNRVTVQNLLIGFVPFVAIELILVVAKVEVYCGTLTPLPPCQGICSTACGQSAWMNGLWLIPLGLGVGALLARRRIPFARNFNSGK